LAHRYPEIIEAGARIVAISIDSPQQNAALIQSLSLPFPMLSDPDRTGAIGPYGLADEKDRRNIARPALVVVTPDGEEAFRVVSRDYADRPTEDAVVSGIAALHLPPTSQEPPQLGPAEPGPAAFKFDQMVPYFRGARFAANAMGGRFPEAREEATTYMEQVDRYIEAAKALYKARKQAG
jgi:hypothetical protein